MTKELCRKGYGYDGCQCSNCRKAMELDEESLWWEPKVCRHHHKRPCPECAEKGCRFHGKHPCDECNTDGYAPALYDYTLHDCVSASRLLEIENAALRVENGRMRTLFEHFAQSCAEMLNDEKRSGVVDGDDRVLQVQTDESIQP